MARTVVNLDEELLAAAARETGLKRKVDLVNEGLRALVAQRKSLRVFRNLRGRLDWPGDPYELRHGRRRSR
jgi:Arc/MetJ family transcription regulator